MNRTELAIIDAFWQILEDKNYNKITVKDIVEHCQVNRNTFYYHFQDIPDLLEQSITRYADQIIQAEFKANSPMDCLEPLINSMKSRKNAILHIYHSVSRDVFIEQSNRLIIHFITKYIDTLTTDITIDPQDKNLLIKFYKCACIGIILDWLDSNMSYDLVSKLSRLSYLFQNSDKNLILLIK